MRIDRFSRIGFFFLVLLKSSIFHNFSQEKIFKKNSKNFQKKFSKKISAGLFQKSPGPEMDYERKIRNTVLVHGDMLRKSNCVILQVMASERLPGVSRRFERC